MNFHEKYGARVKRTGSLLCTGLDPDLHLLPEIIKNGPDPLYHYCVEIVDAVHEYSSAFKPNIAFFEAHGYKGIMQYEKLCDYLKKDYPDIPVIADIKRGDIGNTAKEYASYYFGRLGVDAVTVSPYMGGDSIMPFLADDNNFVFALCLTSNPGSADLQKLDMANSEPLFLSVASMVNEFNTEKQMCGIVAGATSPAELKILRDKYPDLHMLIPGVGTQGGSAEEIAGIAGKYSAVNVSRAILYAGRDKDFAIAANKAAKEYSEKLKIK